MWIFLFGWCYKMLDIILAPSRVLKQQKIVIQIQMQSFFFSVILSKSFFKKQSCFYLFRKLEYSV